MVFGSGFLFGSDQFKNYRSAAVYLSSVTDPDQGYILCKILYGALKSHLFDPPHICSQKKKVTNVLFNWILKEPGGNLHAQIDCV